MIKMSKLKKLGKGLEDISYLFLSPQDKRDEETSPNTAGIDGMNPQDSNSPSLKSVCLIGDPVSKNAFLTINLALALARLGTKILVLDMDEEFSCLSFFLGHEITGAERNSGEPIVKPGPRGVKLVGLNKATLKKLSAGCMEAGIDSQLGKVEEDVDLILMSIGRQDLTLVDSFAQESVTEFLISVPPDKDKMLKSYKTIKTIFSRNPLAKIGIIVTEIEHMYEIERVYNKMVQAVSKFLDKELYKYGFLFKIKESIPMQNNIASFYDTDITACISNIAQILVLRLNVGESGVHPKEFFKKLTGTYKTGKL